MSFADQVDFDLFFASLDKTGLSLSAQDKQKFQSICVEELNKNDSISVSGLMYELFAFIQNLFSGFDIHAIGDSFSSLTHKTGEQEKQYRYQQAAIKIHERCKFEGVNFVRAAEYATGYRINTTNEPSTLPPDMENSLFRQITKNVDLPWGTPVSLNNKNSSFYEAPVTAPSVPNLRPKESSIDGPA